MCALSDNELSDEEKAQIVCELLFYDVEQDIIREFPTDEHELSDLIEWYVNGWNHDKHKKQSEQQKVMDFFVDQWRIYSDFRQIYNINLNEASLHWWEFMGMLWNMPYKLSSFLQVVEMRTRKPSKNASSDEIKTIKEAKEVYGLEQDKPVLTEQQKNKIDDYDRMMEEIRKKQAIAKEVESIMH